MARTTLARTAHDIVSIWEAVGQCNTQNLLWPCMNARRSEATRSTHKSKLQRPTLLKFLDLSVTISRRLVPAALLVTACRQELAPKLTKKCEAEPGCSFVSFDVTSVLLYPSRPLPQVHMPHWGLQPPLSSLQEVWKGTGHLRTCAPAFARSWTLQGERQQQKRKKG